jgi:predicted small lipoprotein YifL
MLSPPGCDLVRWVSFRSSELSSPSSRTSRKIVLGAALLAVGAAIALAGCGRKGGLDPPPLAAPPVPPAPDQQGLAVPPGNASQLAFAFASLPSAVSHAQGK